MILHSIRLHPLAGIADNVYHFNEGMNVICGPNEEGKSTVARAVRQALFLETNLTPKRKADALADVLPVDGGDTVRITLVFLSAEGQFTLEKTWGAVTAVQLTAPNGTVTTDASAVQDRLQAMLPANQAVVEQVLVASQSKLSDAVNDLSSDVRISLSEKLRSAILNGGGISGTQLEAEVTRKINEHFGRWDETIEKPQGGPSREHFTNRWRNGAGKIVNAWYDWQETTQTEMDVEYYDKESNRLQTEQNHCNEQLNSVNAFLQAHRAAYDAVNRRIAIEGDLQKYQNALEGFAVDAQRWPAAVIEKSTTEKAVESVGIELTDLRMELDQARQKQEAKKDVDNLVRINALMQKVEEAKTFAGATKEIPEADIKTAQGLQQKINAHQAKNDGQKLRFQTKADTAAELQLVYAGGKTETLTLVSGEEVTKELSGGVSFEWKGLAFTVQSANEDIAGLEKTLQQTQSNLNELLQKHEQPTIESLSSAAQSFKDAQNQLRQAQASLTAALGNDTMEELNLRCEAAAALPGTRDIKVLEGLIQAKDQLKGSYQTKLATVNNELIGLENKHQSQQNLIQRQVKAGMAIQQKESELTALPPLPDGFASASEFQQQYNSMQDSKQNLEGERHRIELAMQALKEPDQTLAEVKEATIAAEKHFQRLSAEGKAYRRIQQALAGILATADAKAFQPLHDKTEVYLKRLSAGRFHRIPFDATQPQKLEGDSVALPVHLLSKGTKDILALALRLAAADVYLQDRSGFVLMDDPLVDMDRKRREASADVLKEFAQRHQTIIFTCHENHADLLQESGEEQEKTAA